MDIDAILDRTGNDDASDDDDTIPRTADDCWVDGITPSPWHYSPMVRSTFNSPICTKYVFRRKARTTLQMSTLHSTYYARLPPDLIARLRPFKAKCISC